MRLLVAGVLLGACSVAALAQSVTTYGYDARGRLTAMRGGIGARADYGLDAADNRSAYHSTPQFPFAWSGTSLPHRVGYADGGGWAVNAGTTDFMAYGPYTTSIPGGSHTATWRLLVDNNSADNGLVARLDVNDATTMQVIASLDVRRQQWAAPWAYQVFELPFTNTAGHSIKI